MLHSLIFASYFHIKCVLLTPAWLAIWTVSFHKRLLKHKKSLTWCLICDFFSRSLFNRNVRQKKTIKKRQLLISISISIWLHARSENKKTVLDFVCVCVCVCVCVRVCVHACVCVCAPGCCMTRTRVTWPSQRKCLRTRCGCQGDSGSGCQKDTQMWYVYMHIYFNMYIYFYMYMCVYIYFNMYTYLYMFIYIYICIHIIFDM